MLYEPAVRDGDVIPAALDRLDGMAAAGDLECVLDAGIEQLGAGELVRADAPGGGRPRRSPQRDALIEMT